MSEQEEKKEEKKRPISGRSGCPIPNGALWEPGEEQRERARRAGIKSGEVRRQRKTLREELERLLNEEITDMQGRKINTQAAVSTSLISQAIKGNVRAFETIRDTIGEKPVENVAIKSDFTALQQAFSALEAPEGETPENEE